MTGQFLMSSPDQTAVSPDTWQPETPRADLIKAAALIVAEIERLDRAEGKQP
jgi:hypothetical protein